MIKIKLNAGIKEEIKEGHIKDFNKTQVKEGVKKAFTNLKAYENFYNYFYDTKGLKDSEWQALITLDSKADLIKKIEAIELLIAKDVEACKVKNEYKNKHVEYENKIIADAKQKEAEKAKASKIKKGKVKVSKGKVKILPMDEWMDAQIRTAITTEFERLYSNFASRDWAMQFLEKLSINVCPYCNHAYTFAVKAGSKKSKPELDHFFPKSVYPYLAVSIFNIVPSCSSCNRGKGDGAVKKDEQSIYYPYEEGFEERIVFRTDQEGDLNYIIDESKEFEIKLQAMCLKDDKMAESYNKIIESYKEIFKIEEIYKHHKPDVVRLLRLAKMYPFTALDKMQEDWEKEFGIGEKFSTSLIGYSLDLEDIGHKPLGKLIRDIVEEFNIKW